MQVYVHFAGKNHGPYSIDHLRQYVQAGSFKDDNLACYDGANWIKFSQVPGIVPAQPKSVAKKVEQPAKVKTKPAKKLLGIKLLIVGFFLALVISLAGLTYYLLGVFS